MGDETMGTDTTGTDNLISLERYAATIAAGDVGTPREVVLHFQGLTPQAWEASREHWMEQLGNGDQEVYGNYLASYERQRKALEAMPIKYDEGTVKPDSGFPQATAPIPLFLQP